MSTNIDNIGYGIVDLDHILWDEFSLLYRYFNVPDIEDKDFIANRYGEWKDIITIRNIGVGQVSFGVDDIGIDYKLFERMFQDNGMTYSKDESQFEHSSFLFGLSIKPNNFIEWYDIRNDIVDIVSNIGAKLIPVKIDHNEIPIPFWIEDELEFDDIVNSITISDFNHIIQNEEFYNDNNMNMNQNTFNFEYTKFGWFGSYTVERFTNIFDNSINYLNQIDVNQYDEIKQNTYSFDNWMVVNKNNLPSYIWETFLTGEKSINFQFIDNSNHWSNNYQVNDNWFEPFNNEDIFTLKKYITIVNNINIFKNDYILSDNLNHWNQSYQIEDNWFEPFNNESNFTLKKYITLIYKIDLFKNDCILSDNLNHWSTNYRIEDNWFEPFNENKTLQILQYTHGN